MRAAASDLLIVTWPRYEEDVEQPQVVSLVDSYNVMQTGRSRGHKGERGPMGPRVSAESGSGVSNNVLMPGTSGQVYPRPHGTPRTSWSARPGCGLSEVTRYHRGSGHPRRGRWRPAGGMRWSSWWGRQRADGMGARETPGQHINILIKHYRHQHVKKLLKLQ